MVEKRLLAVFIVTCALGLAQWFPTWGTCTPRSTFVYPKGYI